MGLQSAMTTALTGLQAAETTIDIVGNNVANSNTVGFKESKAVFATQFSETQSIGSAPTDTLGGTNPRQIGLGVKVAETTPDFSQGTIEISSNPLDLAIQGEGFLIVQGSGGEQLYTRNGQLSVNANNEIVTITGNRVLGYGVDDNFEIQDTSLVPLSIPIGTAAVAEATENVILAGQLNPNATVASEPGIIESAVLSDGTIEIPDGTGIDFEISAPPNLGSTGAASSATGGGLTAGNYLYRVAFLDADGNEGAPSAALNVTVGAGDDTVDLTTLPLPAGGSDFVAQRIYRTEVGGAGNLFLVAELDPAQANYTDTTDDATLVTAATLDDSTVGVSNYEYYVTFYHLTQGTESRPTSVPGPVNISATGRRVRLDDIPIPGSADFNAVRIYRSIPGSSDFYLVDTIPTGAVPGPTVSYVDSAADADLAGNSTLNLDGPAINAGLELVNVVSRDGANYENIFQEGTLSFTPRRGGATLDTKQFTITSTSTVQDLIDFMVEASGMLTSTSDPEFPLTNAPGGSVTADGRIRLTSNLGMENELDLDPSSFQLQPTGAIATDTIEIPFSSTQDANGEGSTNDFIVYDSLGIGLNVTLTTYLESQDGSSFTYRWIANSPENEPASGVGTTVGTGVITFDGNGDIINVSDSTVSIERRQTASISPLQFELDFSQITGLPPAGPHDPGESFLNDLLIDGFPPGLLSSFVIANDGTVSGSFSNGATRTLGQLQLARFSNPTGLKAVGDNMFVVGVNSGLPVISDPGSQGLGTLTAGAVELSNTDIGGNLIDLILASTQYRGNARVISAAQDLLDELMALRR